MSGQQVIRVVWFLVLASFTPCAVISPPPLPLTGVSIVPIYVHGTFPPSALERVWMGRGEGTVATLVSPDPPPSRGRAGWGAA
jgi:hypothetical protein